MSKLVKKLRKSYNDDEFYSSEDYDQKKKDRKPRKLKYYDEYESFEAHHRYNNKSQKFRTY